MGKYQCVKCDFSTDDSNDLGRFDEEMGMGICFECEPITPHEDVTDQEPATKPSYRHIQRVRKYGSPEQNKLLDAKILAWEKENPEPEKKAIQKREPKKIQKINELDRSMNYLERKMDRKPYCPEGITYDSVKNIFWQYYKQLIFREKGFWITGSDVEPNTVLFLDNFLKWCIGDVSGDFDPRKSIYLWGSLGVGKSTIAEVGFLFMSYLKARTKWSSRHYKFISMDELFLETYTTASLNAIGQLAKGSWCLDELRERHLTYKHYGNDFYMLSDILTARHNLWKRSGHNTIITSNIPPKRLEEVLLDDRLMDRIKQQYVTVELVGANKRHITKSNK